MSEVKSPSELRANYPTNDKKIIAKQKTEPVDKNISKVISGGVVRKKKSLGKKVMETFIGDDTQSVTSYILYDVLIPAAKTTISEMVTGGIEMLLFGEVRKKDRNRRPNGGSYVSYGSYYKGDQQAKPSERNRNRSTGRAYDYEDVIFETRGDAQEVLDSMVDIIAEFGQVSINDMYELCELTGTFTDDKYGWVNLSSGKVIRGRDGYILELPRAELIA